MAPTLVQVFHQVGLIKILRLYSPRVYSNHLHLIVWIEIVPKYPKYTYVYTTLLLPVHLKFLTVAVNAVGAELALVHPALFVVLSPVYVHVFHGSATIWTFLGRLGEGMSIFDMR